MSAFFNLAKAVPSGVPSRTRLRWLAEKHTPFLSSSGKEENRTPKVLPRQLSTNGGGRIRTYGRFTASGFQDQRIRPLCHSPIMCLSAAIWV
jgi:hypothetical protein